MPHLPAMRMFALRPDGVHCGHDGLFVGTVPLLRRQRSSGGRENWSVRPQCELEDELTALYGLPIDATAKGGRLACAARALDRGDLALAGIAAVLLQLPDPPQLEKGAATADDWVRLEKFGRKLIDDPSNLVWVPRLRHEQITAYYNQIDPDDPLRRRRRDVINENDFDTQRAIGLSILRKFGVLQ